MTEDTRPGHRTDEELRGAVIVGIVAGQSPRVAREAARFARMLDVPLVVATVDMGRYLSFDDPTGMMPSANRDLALSAAQAETEAIELETAEALTGAGVAWTLRASAGDPAVAIGELAAAVGANLIVVGTRRPGLGETLREFFNGSVAARLTHRQSCSVLIVPNGAPLAPEEPIVPDEA